MLAHRSLSLTLLVCSAVALGLPGRAAARGNPPSWVAESGARSGHQDVLLEMSSTGSLFLCFEREVDALDHDIVVMRSDDRGDTWTEFVVIGDGAGGSRYEAPRLRIADGPVEERIFVSYVVGHFVKVDYADLNSPTPIWTSVDVMDFTAISIRAIESIDLDTRADPSLPTVVAVGAVVEVASGDFEWFFCASVDAGTTFPAPTSVHAVSGNLFLDAEIGIGLGGGGTAYLFVAEGDAVSDYGELNLYTATNNGTLGWAAVPINVASLGYPLRDLTVATDSGGDGIVVGAEDGQAGTFEVYHVWASNDQGATWVEPTLPDQDDLDHARLVWTTDGPVMVAETRFGPLSLLRPEGGLASNWEAETWMFVQRVEGAGAVVVDPATGEYAVAAQVLLRGGHSATIRFEADWRDQPGYGVSEDDEPHGVYAPVLGAPLVGDVDADGIKEILITYYDDFFDAYYIRSLHPSFAYGSYQSRRLDGVASEASSPAMWDVDADGDQEVFVGLADGTVVGLDHELVPLDGWPAFLGSNDDTWVSIGPVSGYGHAEVVATNGNEVHVLNPMGQEMPGWPWSAASGTAVGRAAIGDVDGDGTTEVVAAFTTGVAILNHDGTVQRVLMGPYVPSAGVTLVDVDDDGDLEIVGPMSDGNVLFVHHDGTSVPSFWPFDAGTGAPVSQVAVANIEDATTPALVFTSAASVFALDANGNLLPGYPQFVSGVQASEPIIARVARPNTARPQIVVGSDDGWVHVWTSLAETPRDWPNEFGRDAIKTMAVADLDGDGVNELVLPAGEDVWILDMGTPALGAARRWPQSGHDRARSGCADCLPGTPTAVGPVAPGATLASFRGSYPNPSSGRSVFQFSLPSEAHVELALYDLRGRRVRSLLSGSRPAGSHELAWDGKDGRGGSIAAGTYFGRLVVSRGNLKQVIVRELAVVR